MQTGERGMRRTFLGWSRPILHSAADALIGGIGDHGPVDLSRHLAVVPGGRAGRRLVELLLDRAEGQGRPLRPPRIVVVGGLPEALFHPIRPAPDPILDRLAWALALAETGDALLQQVFPVPGEGEDSNRGWLDEALVLSRLHASVGAASHDFAGVARVCRRTSLEGGFNDEARWRALSRVQERYRAILRRHGWEDRESARRDALESDRIAASGSAVPAEIWVIGAPDLPAVHRAFLAAAARRIRIHILVGAPASLADRFDAMGCVDPNAWMSELAEIPDGQVKVVSGPNEQASVVVEYLARVAPGRSAEDISIGVPDEALIPCLVERLGAAGVSARYAGGTALERTSEFRLLEGVAAFLRARNFDAFSALLRHPEIERRIRRELELTSVPSLVSLVDRYRALHLPARLEGTGPLPAGGEWVRETWEPHVREVRDALDRVMGPLVDNRPLSRWADPLAELLVDVLGDRSVDRHDEGDRGKFELARSMGLILDGLNRIPPPLDRTVPGHVALRLILDELRGEVVPPAAGEAAVELLGWLELALDDAPVLVVTGVNEPHLPDSVAADPFLPHGLRRALGMLDNDGRWARDLLHLKTLLATRHNTLLVAGRRDGEGNPLLPSRLLLAEDPATVTSRILAFLGAIGAETPADSSTTGGEVPATLSTRGAEVTGAPSTHGAEGSGSPMITEAVGKSDGLAFRLPPDPELSDPEPRDRIAVTAFRGLLADPYRYALEHVLRLRSEDDQDREMDGAGFGGLAHTILERFGRGRVAGSDNPEEITAAVRALMAAEAEARFGPRPLPAVRLQLEQLRGRLRGFARWQAAWRRAGWSIRAVEAAPGGDGVPFEVDGEIIHLRGKVDRIDFHEQTGEWLVLDYKTGEKAIPPEKAHRAGRSGDRRWIDLQLPLYLRMAPFLVDRAGAGVIPPGDTGRIRAGYVVLPGDSTKIGAELADWTPEELAEAAEVARDAVRTLRRNRFTHDPSRVRLYPGDPLAVVLGAGVMRLTEDDEDQDDDEE